MELTTNQTLHGFTVTSVENLPEIDGEALVMTHEKSGAKLLYLKNEDDNKAFSISFKTPPKDSTGVFHILEHSVLCGSDKYPVKEPFVNLLKSSMQTFLNAMTFPDKTMYPVASTNEKDLLNLMDVYLDAVLHPAIYSKPEIFKQEGWHYELENKEAPLRYNGVVYNEMKGALSDSSSVLYNSLCQALFPDTAYSFESGGDPAVIPNLSYEEFIDNHRRHYSLSNSYLILYGNVDIEAMLGYLDREYLSKATPSADAPNCLEIQAPIKCLDKVTPMVTNPENAVMGVGAVVGTAHDYVRILATDILLDTLLGSNEAPLKKALLKAGLSSDVTAYLADSQLQPFALVQLKGCNERAHNEFLPTLTAAVEELCEQGIPTEKLEASLSRSEFIIRERDYGVADGVALSMAAMAGWLYDDSMATTYLRYEDELAFLRSQIGTDYYENLLRELFCTNEHFALAEIKPVEKLEDEAEVVRLAAIKETLTAEDMQTIMEEEAALRRAQEAPDSAEALATLPLLQLSDIKPLSADPEVELIAAQACNNVLPCLHHKIPTRGINYVYHYFDLNTVAFEDLPYLGIMIRLLGKMDTATHRADELDSLIQAQLGTMRFFVESYGDEQDLSVVRPKMVMAASALRTKVADLATLPAEVWSSTNFDNLDKIKEILTQQKVAAEQGFINAGHMAAAQYCATYYAPGAVFRDQLAGVGFYRFVKHLLANFEEEGPAIPARLSALAQQIFAPHNALTSFTGSEEDLAAFWEAAGNLSLNSDASREAILSIPEPIKRNEAFIVPSDVCFASIAWDRRLINGADWSGSWLVANSALSFDFLWNEVRVKGGAYGAGFKSMRTGSIRFYSFRDPNLDATLERFAQTSDWLATFYISEEELRGYLISSVASLDTPKKPREIARRQDAEHFCGLKGNYREVCREEILATTCEKLQELAPKLKAVTDHDARCVFGNREILEKSARDWDLVDLFA